MLRDCGAIDLIPAQGKQRRFREATLVPWPFPQPRGTQEITRAERKGTNILKTTQAISGGSTDDDSPGDNSIAGISSILWHKGTSRLLAFFCWSLREELLQRDRHPQGYGHPVTFLQTTPTHRLSVPGGVKDPRCDSSGVQTHLVRLSSPSCKC